MSARRLIFTLGGFQLALVLFLLVMLTPRYVPSAMLVRTAAPHADSAAARSAMAEAWRRKCRRTWRAAPEVGQGKVTLWSWENDEGLLASTTIDCATAGRCAIDARALIPVKLRLVGCRRG